jgi:hypothetical protein
MQARRRARWLLAAILVALAATPGALARQAYAPSVSDYGGVGLLQTRNARFGDDGLFTIGFSAVDPYFRYASSVQILPGLEASFRFTTVQNRSIGGGQRRGTTAFQDKGADLKLRLVDESEWRPAVAVGLQDMIGTAQFGAEYVVASKRFWDIDVSLGVGWGRLATRGHLPNPMRLISESFKTRGDLGRDSRGGTVTLNQFFAGRNIAFFGGIEWLTPIEGVRLKIEYDPNTYQEEPLGNRFATDSAINVGLAWQPFSWLDLGVGWERGNTLMLRGTLTPNLETAGPILKIDTPPVPLTPRPRPPGPAGVPPPDPVLREWAAEDAAARLFDGFAALGLEVEQIEFSETSARVTVTREAEDAEVDWDAAARIVWETLPPPLVEVTLADRAADGSVASFTLARDDAELALALGVRSATVTAPPLPAAPTDAEQANLGAAIAAAIEAEGMVVDAVRVERSRATLWLRQRKYRSIAQAVGRAARIVAALAPPGVEEVVVVNLTEGVETSRVALVRRDLEDAVSVRGSPEEMFAHATLGSDDGVIPAAAWRPPGRFPDFDWSLAPQYRQHIGGPDAFYLFEVWGRLGAEVELVRGFKLAGSAGYALYSEFDRLKTNVGGRLPRVRSLIDSYLKDEFRPIVDLTASYVTGLGPDWYGTVYGGLLEEMYGGVGGEVLYRPFESRLAVGLDLNHVWQRDFGHGFGFLGYDTTTGHLSLYYDSPFWDLDGIVRVGRYLARDIGVTVDISRRFDSGVALGAFASFTNVSAREFGEGSFDKGFYVSIPLNLFFLRPTRQSVAFAFRPLTRDGGQPVGRPVSLFNLTEGERLGDIADGWGNVLR